MVRESFAQAGKDSRFHVVPNASQVMRFLRQAEELSGAPQPGLVQLDLALPDVHGLQVLAEIKAGADLTMVPVVLLISHQGYPAADTGSCRQPGQSLLG